MGMPRNCSSILRASRSLRALLSKPCLTWGLLLFSLSFASCGTEDSGLSTEQDELNDREALMDIYTPLEGNYQGRLFPTDTQGGEARDVLLQVIVVEAPDGTNENGQVIFRPSLRVVFMYLSEKETARYRTNMVARYYQESGLITMATESSASPTEGAGGGGFYKTMYIRGKAQGDEIEGDVFIDKGPIGFLKVSRTSR